MKKIVSLLLVVAMLLTLAACGSGNTNTNTPTPAASFKSVKIGVALYQDSGPAVDAIKAYLGSLAAPLNATFAYTVLTQTDESANLTKIQELIASGVDGIICTMDLGTPAILNECQAAGVYLAGFLSDYDTSFNTNFDGVYKHPNFLGTVADGPCGEDMTAGRDFLNSLLEYNERNPEAPLTHVAVTMFPTWAFPNQAFLVEQFYAAVEEYNQTAETPIVADPLDEATDVLQFSLLDSTYFAKHPGIDAIMSFAAGSFVYPTLVASGNDTTLKLFSPGYDEGDYVNFGTSGTGTYQQCIVSAIEAINYPLVLLINKLNGVAFPDMPETAERRSVLSIIINSDEDMAKYMNYLAVTGKVENSFYTPDQIVALTAVGNPNATYADLVETLNHMTVEDLK